MEVPKNIKRDERSEEKETRKKNLTAFRSSKAKQFIESTFSFEIAQ